VLENFVDDFNFSKLDFSSSKFTPSIQYKVAIFFHDKSLSINKYCFIESTDIFLKFRCATSSQVKLGLKSRYSLALSKGTLELTKYVISNHVSFPSNNKHFFISSKDIFQRTRYFISFQENLLFNSKYFRAVSGDISLEIKNDKSFQSKLMPLLEKKSKYFFDNSREHQFSTKNVMLGKSHNSSL
jgi:hypothetical protein